MNFFFQAEDGIRDVAVTGVQTCALPISGIRGTTAPSSSTRKPAATPTRPRSKGWTTRGNTSPRAGPLRSEEHTSELQSRLHLVCRLLLEKKKQKSST